MGKVVLYMQMSLDGVVGDVDQWATISDEIMNQSTKRYDEIAISIYGGNTYPTLMILGRDGKVKYLETGHTPEKEQALIAALDKELKTK